MTRMNPRTTEAPMEWEREQDRNIPNIFALDALSQDSTPPPPPTAKPISFSSLHRGASFASQQPKHSVSGWDSPKAKPFRQDSQSTAPLSRENSISRPLSPAARPSSVNNNLSQPIPTTTTSTTTSSSTAAVDNKQALQSEGPWSDPGHDRLSRTLSRAGSSLSSGGHFDMGSLRTDMLDSDQARGDPGRQGISRSSRNGLHQYRTSSSLQNWSEDDHRDHDRARESSESEDGDYAVLHRRRGYQTGKQGFGSKSGQEKRYGKQESGRRHLPPPTSNARAWSENVDLPFILSGYVQVAMNAAIVSFLLYILYNFVVTIQSDVSARMESILYKEIQRIAECEEDYVRYHCAENRPKVFEMCERFRICMQQPNPKIGRASVSAETFALIVNAFVDTISYKTMIFVMVLVFGGLYMTNHALSSYRSNHVLHHQHTITPPSLPPSNSGQTPITYSKSQLTRRSTVADPMDIDDGENRNRHGYSPSPSSLTRHLLAPPSKSLSLQYYRHPSSDSD